MGVYRADADAGARARSPVSSGSIATQNDSHWLVVEDCILPSSEGDTTPFSHQRASSFTSVDHDSEALIRALRALEVGSVALVDLADPGSMFTGQSSGQRALHHPLKPSEAVDVIRQLVVLYDAPVLRLILRHDAEIAIVAPLRAVDWLVVPFVGLAFGSDDVHGHAEADAPVDAAIACLRLASSWNTTTS